MAAPGLATRTLRSILGVMGKGPSGEAATLGEFARNPLAAAGILLPAAGFVGSQVVDPVAEGTYNLFTGADIDKRQRLMDAGIEQYTDNLLRGLEKKRKEEEIRRNMLMVQRASPHLYNQVMAGRRLPQGSVVLGGQPRQDLMEELASSMGSLPDPDPVFS